MKRLILSYKSIFGMANSRSVVLDRFVSLSRNISSHVVKCIAYGDSYSCLDHWIHEVASWIHAANATKCKSKLKAADYVDTLFGYFGDDRADAENELQWFQLSHEYTHRYSQFEITDDLINQTYSVFQNIITACVPILTSKEVLSVPEWFSILKRVLDK